ncbi:MAG: sensor histidine kinase, partial [Archangium sp.]
MTDVALAVQRTRSIKELISTTGHGLEALGLQVALVSLDGGVFGMRYLTADPGVRAVLDAFGGGAGRWPLLAGTLFGTNAGPMLIQDMPAALQEYARALGGTELSQHSLTTMPKAAIASPLHVGGTQWGGLVVLHDELRDDDVSILRLFTLQLGTALEVCTGFERLERRTAELELVHELAVSGAKADYAALCHRALGTVARTTQSDAAIFHRYVPESGEYLMVEAYGISGPSVTKYRRFSIPADQPLLVAPLAVPVASLPLDSELVAAAGFLHMAVVPLTIEGKPVGMLTLGRSRDLGFEDPEVRSAEILGVQMAALLERARLYDESGRLYADLKKSYDELARAQQELVRHEKLAALGELAAVMAHEVRNPLGVIFNSLTTLKRLIKPTGDAEMLLNMVGEEADRLNRIVGDLLDFVRPYELVKKANAVEPIIANAVDAAAQSTLNANVRVLTEF